MKKATVGIILIIMLIPTVEASFDISTDEQTVDLIAGDTETVNLTFTTDRHTNLQLYSTVEPSANGFNISYSENNITFTGEKTITMTIKTDSALSPESYSIQIQYEYYFLTEERRTKDEEDYYDPPHQPPSTKEPKDEPEKKQSPIQKGSFTITGGFQDEPNDFEFWTLFQIIFTIVGTLVFLILIALLIHISRIEKHRKRT